jgi:two-component system, sensor histidine kinase and response regulator
LLLKKINEGIILIETLLVKTYVIIPNLQIRSAIHTYLSKFQVRISDLDKEVRFEVRGGGSLKDAKQELNSKNVDFFIVGQDLTDGNAFDFFSFIKSTTPHLPFIFMSKNITLDIALKATRMGSIDILTIPFSADELRAGAKKAAHQIILDRQTKALEKERKKIRFEFLAVLTHELKAPISAVESYLQIMKSRILGDNFSKYNHMIDRSLIRMDGMRRLIFDLLDLTRIESGQKKREINKINISDLIFHVIEALSSMTQLKKVTIVNNFPPNVEIIGDPIELQIVFNNLISNAIKYNKDNGQVFIEGQNTASYLKISVRDTGIGLSTDEIQRLFGEFVRIRNEKTTNIEGSGLGLSIVKKIVSMYQGTVNVQSKVDEGSTFEVVFTH